MTEKLIYISNEPVMKNSALEETLINAAEELSAKIMVKDFTADSNESVDAPIIILCNDVNVQDETVLASIEKTYFSHNHIILYKPTNNEINSVYERLEGREYFKADHKVTGYSLFGLKWLQTGCVIYWRIMKSSPMSYQGIWLTFWKISRSWTCRHYSF